MRPSVYFMFKMCMNPPSSSSYTYPPLNNCPQELYPCASINEADHLIGWLQLFVGVDGGRSWHFRPLSSYKHLFWVGFWGWEHTQIRIYSWMIYDLARYYVHIYTHKSSITITSFLESQTTKNGFGGGVVPSQQLDDTTFFRPCILKGRPSS